MFSDTSFPRLRVARRFFALACRIHWERRLLAGNGRGHNVGYHDRHAYNGWPAGSRRSQ